MITKRIIPCLDVKNGRVVKGVNFQGVSDVSSPVELAEYYSRAGRTNVQTNICELFEFNWLCSIYIIQKYEERLNRMLKKKEEPIFCICNSDTIYKDAIYTEEQLTLLEKIKNVKVLRGLEHSNIVNNANLFYNKFLK